MVGAVTAWERMHLVAGASDVGTTARTRLGEGEEVRGADTRLGRGWELELGREGNKRKGGSKGRVREAIRSWIGDMAWG